MLISKRQPFPARPAELKERKISRRSRARLIANVQKRRIFLISNSQSWHSKLSNSFLRCIFLDVTRRLRKVAEETCMAEIKSSSLRRTWKFRRITFLTVGKELYEYFYDDGKFCFEIFEQKEGERERRSWRNYFCV